MILDWLYKKIKSWDLLFTTIFLILSTIHIFAVYSSTFDAGLDELRFGKFAPQLIYSSLSILLFFVISNIDYRWLKFKLVCTSLYLLNLSFLFLVFLQAPIANVHRWLTFGFLQFQPSELTKTVLAIAISAILDFNESEVYKKILINRRNNKVLSFFRELRIPIYLLLVVGVCIYLILIQPSGGVSLLITLSLALSILLTIPNSKVYFTILFFLSVGVLGYFCKFLFLVKIFGNNYDVSILLIVNLATLFMLYFFRSFSKKILIYGNLLILLGITLIPLCSYFWNSHLIQDYQKTRIESFFGSQNIDSVNAKYQQDKAMQLFSNAGLWGKGYLKGTKDIYSGVPDGFTDFAYTSFIEEFGFVGGILFNILYMLLLFRIIIIATKSRDAFGRNLGICLACFYTFSYILSIMINLGVLFNTGLATPFLSYGGTNTLILGLNMGLVGSVARISKLKKASYI